MFKTPSNGSDCIRLQKNCTEYPSCSLDFLSLNATTHYDPSIARKVGINAAIILSRIVWSINKKIEIGRIQDNREANWWMWDSIATFCEYSGMSKDSFLTAKKKLETANLIIVEKFNKKTRDHTNHYAVNWQEYRSLFPDSGESLPSIVENPYHRELDISTIDSGESLPSKVEVPDNLPKSLSKSPPEDHSKNHTQTPDPLNPLSKEDEIGNANGIGIFSDNLISFDKGKEKGESNTPEIRKIIPPVRPKQKPKETYSGCFRQARNPTEEEMLQFEKEAELGYL